MVVTLTEAEQDRIVYLAESGLAPDLQRLYILIETTRAEKSADALSKVIQAVNELPEECYYTNLAKQHLTSARTRAVERIKELANQ